ISQINVTPLVDVMLVLLIIFMVTAPILQQGVSVDLPKVAAGPLGGQEEQLVVNVGKGGQLYLNDTPMTPEQLTAKLAAIAAARPPKAEPAEPAKPSEPKPEPKPVAAAEEPTVHVPEKPKPPEPKPEAKPPEPPKPEVKKPEPPKPEPKKPEPPKAAATKPEPPRPPPKPPEAPKATAARPGSPGGNEEAAPHDAYGAAAERWRQRSGGGVGGHDGGSGPIGSGGEGKGGGGQLVGLEFI